MNTKVCNANTCTLCVCTTFHGNASHTCVQHHCMVACVCLYVYDCICLIVCVWLYDNVGMMSWWRTQDQIQLVTACHPTWLRLYQFMLVEIPGEAPEGSNADTLLDSCLYHCAEPLHACMCMIVWQCAHDVIAKNHRATRVSIVKTYNPTWLRMFKTLKQNIKFQAVRDSTRVYFFCAQPDLWGQRFEKNFRL